MNKLYFWKYKEEEEERAGEYWQFLDATAEDLKKDDICLYYVSEIIKQISNEELKYKMTRKLYQLVMENGIFNNSDEHVLEVFSTEEVKQLLEKELRDNIDRYTRSEDDLYRHRKDLAQLFWAFRMLNNVDFEYSMAREVLDRIKDYSNKTILVNLIETYNYSAKYFNMYNKLTNDYYDYLPLEYKNYLKIEKDQLYVFNKINKFMDIDIGIDPKISIGPEIEANIDYCFKFDLRNQIGLDEYHTNTEATVPNGIEITPSKPFHNVPREVAKFCALCETMTEMGYYYSDADKNAAGQINLGLDYLDTKEAILNFYEIYCNCEELLYYISSEKGQLFRQGVYTNSRIKALSQIIGKRVLDESLTRSDVIRLFNKTDSEDKSIHGLMYKKNSVCLRGSYEGDFRLEFRIPNGGCNYRTWIDNIRLYGKMLEAAKKLADMMKKDYLTTEEETMLKLKINMQDNSLSLEEKLHMLMYLLFKDDPIKRIYYDRFKTTIEKIEETNSKRYKNDNPYEPNFDTVIFEEKYQSRLDPDYVGKDSIEYDPKNGIIKH